MKLKIHLHDFPLGGVAMQVLEQEGLPEEHMDGQVRIVSSPVLRHCLIFLQGSERCYNHNIAANDRRSTADIVEKITAFMDELAGTEEPKRGDKVEVKDHDMVDVGWVHIKYHGKYCGRIVSMTDDGKPYEFWDEMRPLSKVKYTKDGDTHTWEVGGEK